jgi:hypothetical protein
MDNSSKLSLVEIPQAGIWIVGQHKENNTIVPGIYGLNIAEHSNIDKSYENLSKTEILFRSVAELIQNVMDWVAVEVGNFTTSHSPPIPVSLGLGAYLNPTDGLFSGEHLKIEINAQTQRITIMVVPDNNRILVEIAVDAAHNTLHVVQFGTGMLNMKALLLISKTSKREHISSAVGSKPCNINYIIPQAGGHGVGFKQSLLLCLKYGWNYQMRGTINSIGAYSAIIPYLDTTSQVCVQGQIAGRNDYLQDSVIQMFSDNAQTVLRNPNHDSLYQAIQFNSQYTIDSSILFESLLTSHVLFRIPPKHRLLEYQIIASVQSDVNAYNQFSVLDLPFANQITQVADRAVSATYVNGVPISFNFETKENPVPRIDILLVTNDITLYTKTERGREFNENRLDTMIEEYFTDNSSLYSFRNSLYKDISLLEDQIRLPLLAASENPTSRWARCLFENVKSVTVKQCSAAILSLDQFYDVHEVQRYAAKCKQLHISLPPNTIDISQRYGKFGSWILSPEETRDFDNQIQVHEVSLVFADIQKYYLNRIVDTFDQVLDLSVYVSVLGRHEEPEELQQFYAILERVYKFIKSDIFTRYFGTQFKELKVYAWLELLNEDLFPTMVASENQVWTEIPQFSQISSIDPERSRSSSYRKKRTLTITNSTTGTPVAFDHNNVQNTIILLPEQFKSMIQSSRYEGHVTFAFIREAIRLMMSKYRCANYELFSVVHTFIQQQIISNPLHDITWSDSFTQFIQPIVRVGLPSLTLEEMVKSAKNRANETGEDEEDEPEAKQQALIFDTPHKNPAPRSTPRSAPKNPKKATPNSAKISNAVVSKSKRARSSKEDDDNDTSNINNNNDNNNNNMNDSESEDEVLINQPSKTKSKKRINNKRKPVQVNSEEDEGETEDEKEAQYKIYISESDFTMELAYKPFSHFIQFQRYLFDFIKTNFMKECTLSNPLEMFPELSKIKTIPSPNQVVSV